VCSKYQYFVLGLYEKAILEQTPYFGGPLVGQILGSPCFEKVNLEHFGDLGIDGKLISRWVLKYSVRLQTGFIVLTGVSFYAYSNESS
jgi:hypothetical protein